MEFNGHPPIPGYEPIQLLGQNGAIVYKARSDRFDKPVVLCVWTGHALPASVNAVVGLEHPNILRVLDVGEVDGHAYCALEYLEGAESLGVRLRRGPVDELGARRLTAAIASVMQFVRERKIAVAPLTPGNVLLGETPKVRLCGLEGHDTHPDFMAPEELWKTPEPIAAALDVYRVGALMYAMLTGRSPRSTNSEPSTGWYLESPPLAVRRINPAISKTLESICMKCVEENPRDRYQSLTELIDLVKTR